MDKSNPKPAETTPFERKTAIYCDAILNAMNATENAVGSHDVTAAIYALSLAQARLIAKVDDRAMRRQLISTADRTLAKTVVDYVQAARRQHETRKGVF